jgi:hypothetical protein
MCALLVLCQQTVLGGGRRHVRPCSYFSAPLAYSKNFHDNCAFGYVFPGPTVVALLGVEGAEKSDGCKTYNPLITTAQIGCNLLRVS